jgi:hypothetical protein
MLRPCTTPAWGGSLTGTRSDMTGYDAGDRNLYAYVSDSPIARVDPSGEFCQIAVRCNDTAQTSGVHLGTHCGLDIRHDYPFDNPWTDVFGGQQTCTSLDGIGGRTNQIQMHRPCYNGGGPFVDFPDSVCKCLLNYGATFNPLNIPRENLEGNSNWTLYCMVSECGFKINWAAGAPIGYKKDGCCKERREYGVIPNDGVPCPLTCKNYWQCP